MPTAHALPHSDRYQCFSDLARREREGHAYQRIVIDRAAPIVVIAPHGGGIEPGTSELAQALAGEALSLYCFEGLKITDCEYLHIASHRFDDPICLNLTGRARAAITVHGCLDPQSVIYLGGLSQNLRDQAQRALSQVGFAVGESPTRLQGQHRHNICNRTQTGQGLQIELSLGLRETMFAGLTRSGRQKRLYPFDQFVSALQRVVSDYLKEGGSL